MRQSNYSQQVTRYATIQQARDRYKLSRNILMDLAKEHKALLRISDRCIRIDCDKLDKALETMSA